VAIPESTELDQLLNRIREIGQDKPNWIPVAKDCLRMLPQVAGQLAASQERERVVIERLRPMYEYLCCVDHVHITPTKEIYASEFADLFDARNVRGLSSRPAPRLRRHRTQWRGVSHGK
jgi:hypothetical protein